MKTTSTKLIAILTIVTIGLAAGTASADNKNKGNNNNSSNKKSGISISFGGGSGNFHVNNNFPSNHHVKKAYVVPKTVITCYRPLHRFCYVLPGDTWYTIAQREYGNVNFCHYIASYNKFSMSTVLVAGQQILLPEIHPNGVLTASTAPLPAAFVAAPVAPILPVANLRPATVEPTRTSVALGSVLMLDGQTFGEAKGLVRLRISGLAMPVEVLEWTASSAKIRLPEMELAAAVPAEIEVLRADGSVASKSAIQLTPAISKLAQGN